MAAARSAGASGAVRGLAPADALVLRLAFAAAFGFTIAILLKWEFSFLAPMLAVQILAAVPIRPSLGQGLAIPLVIFVSTTGALFVCSVLIDSPAVLLAVVGLVICLTFYGQRRGVPAVMMLLVQIGFCGVPLMASVALDLAHTFADFLQSGSIAAIATVWIAHALFPAPAPPPGAKPPAPVVLPRDQAARVAITDSLVLVPLLALFMLGGNVNNFVILMTTINLVRAVTPGGTGQTAVAMLAGNILGGGVAVVAQQFVVLADTLAQFLLTVFLAGLVFGARVARGGPAAPIYGLALATFLLLIGIAITPLPGGSEESFVLRVLKIGAASLYVLGVLSLVARWRRTS